MSACLAIIGGVAALALLSGGVSNNQAYEVTIPQQVGQGTNVVAVSQPQYSYAPPQQAYAPAPQAYAPQYGAPAPQYGAPAPQYGPEYGQPGIGASLDVNGQSAIGAGAYSDGSGTGIGANIGGANIGIGTRSY